MARNETSAMTRLLQRVAAIEPEETGAVVTAFLLFFCVFCGYFAVRPVRETVGTILGADRVADLFIATWIASIAIVPLFGTVAARFRRSTFLPWIYAFVAASLLGCGWALRTGEGSILVSQFFFVFISVLNLFIVSVFWSFLLELFNPNQTKRLFGFIAAGGTAGALCGPLFTDITVQTVGNAGILFVGGGLFVLAIVFQRILLGIWARSDWDPDAGNATERVPQDRPLGGNPFAGFTLLFKSPYLLGITSFVVLLAAVNTFLYFEQLRIVADTFTDTEQRTRIFSRLDFTVQSLTLLLQIAFTGRIAARFGVGALLTAVPVAMVLGFLVLAASGTFAALALVMIARRVGEYSFVRPGREMLFSVVDTETKYKAKNTIDVPVYRGGDAITAQVDKFLSSGGMSAAGVALVGAGVSAVWAVNGWLLGRYRRRHEGETLQIG